MKIVPALLPVGQYMNQVYTKRNIVLHHTVSSTARSALTWWATDPGRIGTAYVIDKDGTIYEAFQPEYWAHHLGLTTPNNTALNRCSIGIELANEGPLKFYGYGFRWNFGPGRRGALYTGQGCTEAKWRGFEAWANYTDEQYQALNELLPMLLDRFDLNPTLCPNLEYDPRVADKYTIYAHCNIRRDKSDVSPAFDFSRLTCLKTPMPV